VPGRDRLGQVLAALAFTLALASGAAALEPSVSLAHYGYDAWDSDSGLPQNSVNTILQTRDGYLWLGTQEGLVRFDGVHFRVFDTRNTAALGDDYVETLCQTRDGALWIGTLNGLARYKDGQFARMTFGDTLENQPVFALLEASDGALWIGARYGAARLSGRVLSKFWHGRNAFSAVRSFAELPGGEIWFAEGDGVGRYWNGRFKKFGTESGLSGIAFVVSPDGGGGLWVGTSSGLFRLDAGRALSYPLNPNDPDKGVRAIYQDRAGTLWIGTLSGVYGLREGRLVQFTTANGLASDGILALFEDREGSLWIGTSDGGLNRLKDQRIANFTIRDGLTDNKIWTVFEDSAQNLWVGTANGSLSRMKHGENRFSEEHDFANRITTMAEDASGNLWLGTRDRGVFRFDGRQWKPFGLADGLPALSVSSICSTRDGAVWIAVLGGGLVRYENGALTKYRAKDGLPNAAIVSLFEDRSGDLWIGSFGGGVARLHEGRFQIFTTKDGLPHNSVISISQDEHGIFWLGTRGGLARYGEGRFTVYRKNEGLFHDAVQRAVDDGHGYLWLTTNHGVFRVSLAELNDVAANPARGIHPVEFATANGMRSAECNNAEHGVARGKDGRLWFATVKGLAMADPAHIQINRVPPQVVVEETLANGRHADLSSGAELQPERRDLEIHYTAFSFRLPGAIRFKYRLSGFDSQWVDAGARRVAYYTNLPPGAYRFEIAAANEDGLWSAPETRLSFSIGQHVYDTTGFRIGVAAVILALVASAHRARVLRLRKREGMRSELAEAKLHALRAQLRPHFLFNTFNAVLPFIDSDPGRAKGMIIQLADLLRASLKSEPGQLVTVDEELAILEQYTNIERTRFGDRIRVAVEVDSAVRAARVPSFLLQPLVENAIKHGMKGFTGPVLITVTVRADGRTLHLRVQDNGRGIPDGRDLTPLEGIGISNVRRRLEALYPKRHAFSVHNLEMGGCEASVEIPLDAPPARKAVPAEAPASRRETA